MPTYQTFQWRRRRLVIPVVIAGLVGSLVVALSLTASLSGYTASITNSSNTAASQGGLTITETSGLATCNSYDSTASCGTIDKYGGTTTPLVPGGSAQTVAVTFLDTSATAVSSAALTANLCQASMNGTAATGGTTPTTPNTTAGNLCSQLNVKIYKGAATGTPLYSGSPAAFPASIPLGGLTANVAQTFTFVTSLPASADPTSAGQKVLQQLTWTFNA